MASLIDLTGQRFGRLRVMFRAENRGPRTYWHCLCDCGRQCEKATASLRHGDMRCCGCSHPTIGERNRVRSITHGAFAGKAKEPPEYKSWVSAKSRCYNPRHTYYAYYGGRGITMCDEWRDNFAAFLRDMGPRTKGTTLDRIDNNGPYAPGNCRWTTWDRQNNNRRDVYRIEWNGVTKTISEWSRETGISTKALRRRVQNGWPPDRMLTEPVRPGDWSAWPKRPSAKPRKKITARNRGRIAAGAAAPAV